MTKRGVRTWEDPAPDLFEAAPPAPPAPAAPPPTPGAPRRRYTDRENRRLEKVLEVFKAWLGVAKIEELREADMAKLMVRFAPMQDWDIAQMIEGRIRSLSRKR